MLIQTHTFRLDLTSFILYTCHGRFITEQSSVHSAGIRTPLSTGLMLITFCCRRTDPGAFHSFRPTGESDDTNWWISAALLNQLFPIDGDQKARINAEIYGASRPQDSGWLKKTTCSDIMKHTSLFLQPLTSRLNSPHPPSLPPSGANQITLSTPRLKWADVHISCSARTQTCVNLCLCPRRFAC